MRFKSSPNKLSIPTNEPASSVEVAILLVRVALSDLTIVADAPPESVMTTSLLLKSIGVSKIILSPANVDELSIPFRTISSKPSLSICNSLELPSLEDESVPFNTITGGSG